MEIKKGVYKLKGKLMNYAWGGYEFLPALLHVPNPDRKPCAEYWLGAHPLASSLLVTPDGDRSLYELIKQHPYQFLSKQTVDRFGQLPYLFKVLDVRDVLSIQVHPGKAGAEEGFAKEEAAGIPPDAPHRNYKDQNHKPETMVALGEFWLLHGFKSLDAIDKVLEDVPEFNILLPLFRKQGLRALYQFVMEMQQEDVNVMLLNLIKRELRKKQGGELGKENPGWWVARLFEGSSEIGTIDRAIFSIYFFNIVKVNAGESVFQGAGLPHAYMEGQCVELMANSDNVLRAGLTPKHIDVPELMKHTVFESVVPNVMKGDPLLDGEKVYPCPVSEFGIAKIELAAGGMYQRRASSLEILIVTEGGILVNHSLVLKRGEAAAVMAGEEYEIRASGHCVVFRAFVPEAVE